MEHAEKNHFESENKRILIASSATSSATSALNPWFFYKL